MLVKTSIQQTAVIPDFDYMDVVGRATQEAKAERRYPVNNRCLYSFYVLVLPFIGKVLFFVQTKEKYPKENCP